MAAAPDGRWVAAAPPAGTGHPEGTLAIYDRSGDVTHVLRGHTNWVMTLLPFDGGRSLASAGDTVRVWDFTGDEPKPAFASERLPVTGRLASDARGRLWSGHRDGTVVGWDVATGRRTATFAAFGDEITGLVLLGERLVTSSKSSSSLKFYDSVGPDSTGLVADLPLAGSGVRVWEAGRGSGKLLVENGGSLRLFDSRK